MKRIIKRINKREYKILNVFLKRRNKAFVQISFRNLKIKPSQLHAFELFKLLIKVIKNQLQGKLFSIVIADIDLSQNIKKKKPGL